MIKTSASSTVYLTVVVYLAALQPMKLWCCSDHSNNNPTMHLLRKSMKSNTNVFAVCQLIAFMFPAQNVWELTLNKTKILKGR